MHTRWYQCVCATTWHQVRHNPSLIWGRHWALKDRRKPRYKNLANPHSSTKHSLYNNPNPPKFNHTTPNAYQMIALCLCNNMAPSERQTFLNVKETLSFERQVLAKVQNLANLHSSTRHSVYNNSTPLEFSQATPNAYQMIALCLCNNMTPNQTQPLLNLRDTLSFERQGLSQLQKLSKSALLHRA